MNTIKILFSNKERNIGSFYESKITKNIVNLDLMFAPAYNIILNKTLLKTLIKELSALTKFKDSFYIGNDDGLSFIYVRNTSHRMNIEYRRNLFITNDTDLGAHYSIKLFTIILKNLKSKNPVITISTNKLMIIEDNNNTYALANKEIDLNAKWNF